MRQLPKQKKVSKKALVMKIIALKLLIKIIAISHVYFKYLKNISRKVKLQMKTLITSKLQGKL